MIQSHCHQFLNKKEPEFLRKFISIGKNQEQVRRLKRLYYYRMTIRFGKEK